MIEARIRLIEARIALAQVIDPLRLSGSRISFGATVTLLDLDTEDERTYAIVGEDEANFKHGLISYKSPIARGILGRLEGDDVEVPVADGVRSFEILTVSFQEIPLPAE